MAIIDYLSIFGAKYLYLIALFVAGVYFLKLPWQEKKQIFVFGIVALPIMFAVLKIAAALYFDPRPFVVGHFTPLIPHDPDNGFPSDHTLLLSAVASLVFPFNKKMSSILWVFVVLVGVSRVYTGIHHPIDIIGSIIIAVAVASAVYPFVNRSKYLIS